MIVIVIIIICLFSWMYRRLKIYRREDRRRRRRRRRRRDDHVSSLTDFTAALNFCSFLCYFIKLDQESWPENVLRLPLFLFLALAWGLESRRVSKNVQQCKCKQSVSNPSVQHNFCTENLSLSPLEHFLPFLGQEFSRRKNNFITRGRQRA